MLLFCYRVYLHWWPILTTSVCNMLLCSLHFHWWWTLMPSGCNMCNSCNRLALVTCLLIRLRRIFNFWLFHANILQLSYTFSNFLYYFLGLTYWSSAQCQFLFVACFFASQKIHIKRSPNGIKTDGDFFGIYVNFGKWKQRETMPEWPMRVRGAPWALVATP